MHGAVIARTSDVGHQKACELAAACCLIEAETEDISRIDREGPIASQVNTRKNMRGPDMGG
jgi:hypothetical protein